MMYEPRAYRRSVEPAGLVAFEVSVAETDLSIAARRILADQAVDLIRQIRHPLETYVLTHPTFAESFAPVAVEADAPEIVRAMARAAERAEVGPMAAVAGAIAERVARGLARESDEVIVENGGDIYLVGATERLVSVWAGGQGAAGLGLRIGAELLPVAVCTSSGRVGHSLSFGAADAAVVIARDGALADACATSLANHVRGADDVGDAVARICDVAGVLGAVATAEGAVAACGAVELVPVEGPRRSGG